MSGGTGAPRSGDVTRERCKRPTHLRQQADAMEEATA
jgi:hypothetical protein